MSCALSTTVTTQVYITLAYVCSVLQCEADTARLQPQVGQQMTPHARQAQPIREHQLHAELLQQWPSLCAAADHEMSEV
jgi:hypothetical protein